MVLATCVSFHVYATFSYVNVGVRVCLCVCVYTQVVIMNDLLFYNKHAVRRRSRRRRRRRYDV